MVTQLKTLSPDERVLMMNAPALVSVLAACSNDEIDATRKAVAVEMAHLKTFTADPLLIPYYSEVEKEFKKQFEAIVRHYGPCGHDQREAMKEKLHVIIRVAGKLEPVFRATLLRSIRSYAEHVKKSSCSIFDDFIFPVSIARSPS